MLCYTCCWVSQGPDLLQLIGIDNKSGRDLPLNPVHHQRSKHIDVKFHWIRDKIEDKTVELEKADTTQRAGILTKASDTGRPLTTTSIT